MSAQADRHNDKYNFARIPSELRDKAQWVVYKLEKVPGKDKLAKVPYDAKAPVNRPRKASSTDPRTWATFKQAINHARAIGAGVGYVLTESDELTFVDLDDCVIEGVIAPWALKIVTLLDTYTEVSQSGKGLHMLCGGIPPKGRHKVGSVEMYNSGRFVAMTGHCIEGTPATIATRQAEIEAIHRRYLGQVETPKAQAQPQPAPILLTDDQAVINRMCAEKGKGHKWESLYAGNWQGFYKDQSVADLSLCEKLAFYTGRDEGRVDQIFRRSGLMRPKWDKRHRGDGATYGEMTVEKAVAGCRATYTGLQPSQPQPAPAPNADCDYTFDEAVEALRLFNKTVDKADYVPVALQSVTGYRSAKTDGKGFDASIDKAVARARFTNLPLPDQELAERCNFGSSNTARACKARLMGWFLIPNEKEDRIGVARTFDINPQFIGHVVRTLRAEHACVHPARNVDATSPVSSYSVHKNRDAFATGHSKTARAKRLRDKPLVETFLLIMDTIERVGPLTRKELCEVTKRKSGSIALSTRRAEELGILDVEQEDAYCPKIYSLAPDAWSTIDVLEPKMKTWRIGEERAERNAERTQDRCNRILAEADEGKRELSQDERVAIEVRKERAERKRERLLSILHPDWTSTDLMLWIYKPKPKFDPIKHAKRDRRHAQARMDMAEARRSEEWQTNARLAEAIAVFRSGDVPKREWHSKLRLAGFTPKEASRGVKGAYA